LRHRARDAADLHERTVKGEFEPRASLLPPQEQSAKLEERSHARGPFHPAPSAHRRAVTWRLILPLIVSLCAGSFTSFAAAPPNVLFIAVDDLRPEIGCYGAKHMQTPNLDRIAARGLLFERAYCQVAVCNPSRNSLLSGCRPDTTGVLDNQHFLRQQLPEVVTLPQHFKNHGHTTLSLGKIFHHSEREPGDDPQSWSEPAWYHGEPYRNWFTRQSLDYVKQLKALPKEKQPKQLRAAPFEAADEPDEVYPDGMTATKAIETLRRLERDGKPFFLGVGFVKPHLPFTCPQKYWDLYPADTITLATHSARPTDAPEPAFHTWYELRSYGTVPETGGITDDMARHLIRGYRACVSFMDAQLGRVLDELDRLGLRENTVVVLWGDHGYHLGEHGLWAKQTLFEGANHVPLLIAAPGVKPGARSGLAEQVDIYPTLCDLAGLPKPKHLQGRSVKPMLDDPSAKGKQVAISTMVATHTKEVGHSLRTDSFRYVAWEGGDELLYDHRTDPDELQNLADKPAQAERMTRMRARLAAHLKMVGTTEN